MTTDVPLYAIGIEHQPNSFGMVFGPTPDLQAALDFYGEDKSILFRFNPDGTDDRLYRWADGQWHEVANG